MWLVSFPTSCPFWFSILAIGWSAFQFYAGYNYGTYIYDQAFKNETRDKRKRIWAYGVHHGIQYFICCLAGFIAWLLLISMTKCPNCENFDTGYGAILFALFAFSVIGISGALARILYLGKYP